MIISLQTWVPSLRTLGAHRGPAVVAVRLDHLCASSRVNCMGQRINDR